MGGAVIVIESEEQWAAELDKAKADGRAIIVDFTATWCGPCRMIGPYFDELSSEFPRVTFLKVDVDANATVAALAGVNAMPTFQVYRDGAKVAELVGAAKDKLKALCEEHQGTA